MKKAFFLLCAAILLAGCGKPGKEFIGTWKGERREKIFSFRKPQRYKTIVKTMEIRRNGDSFLLIEDNGKHKYVATYVDGVLRVNVGFGALDVAYEEDKDAILLPNPIGEAFELRRVK
jgi:hypothetical protein